MRGLFFILLFTITSCVGQNESLKEIKHLSKELTEISGIEILEGSDLIWAINDSGNPNIVYGFTQKGELQQEIEIENAENVDWEDLAKDNRGTLYIADTGNNDNDREDLTIYIIEDFLQQKEEATAKKIEFSFEDQEAFPADDENMNFGSEALIYKDEFLYMFTKNRSKHPDGTVNVYKLPAKPGTYKAKKIGSYQTCEGKRACWITAASINPEENEVILLSEEHVWKLSDFEGDDFFGGNIQQYDIPGKRTQKESICYKNSTTAFLADEKESKKKGRNLYEFSLK